MLLKLREGDANEHLHFCLKVCEAHSMETVWANASVKTLDFSVASQLLLCPGNCQD